MRYVGLGSLIKTVLSSIGITEENVTKVRSALGMSAKCKCSQRVEQINRMLRISVPERIANLIEGELIRTPSLLPESYTLLSEYETSALPGSHYRVCWIPGRDIEDVRVRISMSGDVDCDVVYTDSRTVQIMMELMNKKVVYVEPSAITEAQNE